MRRSIPEGSIVMLKRSRRKWIGKNPLEQRRQGLGIGVAVLLLRSEECGVITHLYKQFSWSLRTSLNTYRRHGPISSNKVSRLCGPSVLKGKLDSFRVASFYPFESNFSANFRT